MAQYNGRHQKAKISSRCAKACVYRLYPIKTSACAPQRSIWKIFQILSPALEIRILEIFDITLIHEKPIINKSARGCSNATAGICVKNTCETEFLHLKLKYCRSVLHEKKIVPTSSRPVVVSSANVIPTSITISELTAPETPSGAPVNAFSTVPSCKTLLATLLGATKNFTSIT